ncbi:MAG: hypothetical protein K0U47_00660, partial [Epsilonproteobacteria bacterium]|nr:hypothetical protein [Campylobacterota bacterium]
LLTQLGYSINDATLQKIENVINNTQGFSELEKHIIQLNDTLKHHLSHIALSNSHDYFKIKNGASSAELIAETDEIIQNWAQKYKTKLSKVEGKETYYIIGKV